MDQNLKVYFCPNQTSSTNLCICKYTCNSSWVAVMLPEVLPLMLEPDCTLSPKETHTNPKVVLKGNNASSQRDPEEKTHYAHMDKGLLKMGILTSTI